jgi:hypothetical protein
VSSAGSKKERERNMTVQDYIKKHSLQLWRKWPDFRPDPATGGMLASWTATVLTDPEQGKFDHADKIEIFSNTEKTLFVSLNVSAGLFRIVHNDLLQIASGWEPINANYVHQSML